MGCGYMGEYTWPEFEKGCLLQECDTADKWKQKIPSLRQKLSQESELKKIYKYAFDFAREKGKVNVEIELACEIWKMFITECPFLD